MDKTRILIADRRPRIRFALRALLKRQMQLQIVGEAANVEDLERQIESVCPDAVLLSWRLDGLATANWLVALTKNRPELHVIVLSGRPEVQRAALAAGADVFVSKIDPPDKLLAAIESVRCVQAALPSLGQCFHGADVSQ
jgi:two-component system nitrate/nitrite response regulator NarL